MNSNQVTVTETSTHRSFAQSYDRVSEVQFVKMDVRRVERDHGVEVQIEMTMTKRFKRSERTTQQHHSFCMDAATAALFAGAILEQR